MFRVRVLGGFALEGPTGSPTPSLPKRRAEAVLAVLAVSGDLGCTRERLAAILWPDADEERARHGLRDCLHDIRGTLGHEAIPAGARLRLDPAVVDSDVQQFVRAREAGGHEEMVRIYSGPLLDGFHVDGSPEFEQWLAGERARLARDYAEALRALATAAEDRNQHDQAAKWWARAVEHDPLSSPLVLRYLRALTAAGDRATAIKVADAHVRLLKDELSLTPDRDLQLEMDRIRRVEPTQPTYPTHPTQPTPRFRSGQAQPTQPTPRFRSGQAQPTHPTTQWRPVAVIAIAIIALFGVRQWMRASDAASRAHPTIAVLPFRSLGSDSSTAHFAAGLQDELLTQLTKVASLRVVGRTSVGDYDGSEKPVEQIARELGVRSVALGSVQVDGNRLRVIVRLVDAGTRQDLWGEHYDRTLEDAFAVQSDIARQIVAALGARLTVAEAGAIGEAPTSNPQAYQLFLQGRDYHRRPGWLRQDLLTAEQLYSRAVALDSTFGAARAALARVILDRYVLKYENTPARLELGRKEAEIAVRLAPGLPEAHLAAGLVLTIDGKSAEALDEYRAGLRIAPTSPELWAGIGHVLARLGQWDSAITALNTALQYDPRASNLLQRVGDLYHVQHRYPEAIAAYRRELALAPNLPQPHISLAWSYVLSTGQIDTLRAALRGVPLDADMGLGAGTAFGEHLALATFEGKPDSVLALIRAARETNVLAHWHWSVPAYRKIGKMVAWRATLDSVLVRIEKSLVEFPEYPGLHEDRGIIKALVGQREEAVGEARWLAQWAADHPRPRTDWRVGRAQIFALLGEMDSAIAELEPVLSGPSLTTVHYLRLDPFWEPLVRDARFEALVAKYGGR